MMRPALLLAVLLSGCANPRQTVDPARAEPSARIGQTIRVDGPSVTPLAVIEDSRCPRGAACVWAGRVRINARVTTGAGAQMHELTLGQPVHVADGALTLVSVMPEPGSSTLGARDYHFGFAFAGGI